MIIGLAVAGALCLLFFVLQELRAPEPLLPMRLFRNPVFTIGNLIGFVVGMAMFGALAFLPVYLQVVKGASATESGLRLIPMMLGLIGASIISGRLISATGRYRVFPILGTATITAGLYLLSRLTVDSSPVEVSVYMLVLGIGVGLVMQVLVLAIQNSTDYADLGVATAGANLFRSLGSAFGVAIFGSILNNRLDYHLERLVPSEALNGISIAALTSSPAAIARLPDAVHAAVLESFALSLHSVFVWAIPVGILGFIASWFLPEHVLRSTAHVGNREAPASPRIVPVENVETAGGGS
jgi:predicted MFS family arabinose efflux permease